MTSDKLKKIEFSEKSHSFRKLLSIILLFVLIGGWTFLIGYNIYMTTATAQIRIHPQGFYGDTTNNESKVVGGSFVVENDHWNSIAIRDFNITYSMSTDNGTELAEDSFIQDIPSNKNTTLNIYFNFSIYTGMSLSDLINIGLALNATKSLIFEISLSFKYGLYSLDFSIKIEKDFEVNELI